MGDSSPARNRTPDPEKLNAFVGRFVADLGASFHGATIVLGEKLGLYKALAGADGLTSEELARKTATAERFVREWLAAQVASGYVSWEARKQRYYLTPEQEFTLTNENGPAYFPGAFFVAASMYRDEPKILEAFRTGTGVDWPDHDHDLFVGTNKFFRPNYLANLISGWLPALDGVVTRLEEGGRVADVGCGFGSSTRLMAQAYPNSDFVGFDYHAGSIRAAQEIAVREGLSARTRFEVARAQDFPGQDLDLVTFFDCLHDMADPVGAVRHARQSLNDEGTLMVVEPMAGNSLDENINPVGRVFYSASTMICTPASMAQPNGAGLGAQTGDDAFREIGRTAGFTRFRRAAETPFNRVLEFRP
ncbi:MAG: class I SAM-dependent methyltransferase [Thermoplasmata archaeon]|nr:class I SAM-dependent methyltransferase [Thermoplasmata archaeon]